MLVDSAQLTRGTLVSIKISANSTYNLQQPRHGSASNDHHLSHSDSRAARWNNASGNGEKGKGSHASLETNCFACNRLTNDVVKLRSSGKPGHQAVHSTPQHQRKVLVSSPGFSNPLLVGVENKQVSDGNEERRGQTKGDPRLKHDSSHSIFERADVVERNVGRVFGAALVQMYC